MCISYKTYYVHWFCENDFEKFFFLIFVFIHNQFYARKTEFQRQKGNLLDTILFLL